MIVFIFSLRCRPSGPLQETNSQSLAGKQTKTTARGWGAGWLPILRHKCLQLVIVIQEI